MPEPVGFYTDTTICIGCKACQVACHEWNQLPAGKPPGRQALPLISGHDTDVIGSYRPEGSQPYGNGLSGKSYDNTLSFSSVNWRHVKFIEQIDDARTKPAWLMMSDVCKHCVNAPCLEVCPTGAILRTEFDTVYINQPACNGCRDCVSACPFGVIHVDEITHLAQKCTFCYDRLKVGKTPACAQACPTQSIRYGPLKDLKKKAQDRVAQLKAYGEPKAQLYGADDKVLGGLNSFYLLVDSPETYGLPSQPKIPSRNVPRSSLLSILTGFLAALGLLFSFRNRPNQHQPSAVPPPTPKPSPPPKPPTDGIRPPEVQIHTDSPRRNWP
jgi:formate dehydrogenase iron-sulfur subunit